MLRRVAAWLKTDKGRKAVLKSLADKSSLSSLEELKGMTSQLKEITGLL